mmetsp:Transcript_27155/g.63554  ORF Transcript_27155/g.63554 Transcript_27155/m.63554 type:complete len:85 (-) Transcript_27155:179-433(-)
MILASSSSRMPLEGRLLVDTIIRGDNDVEEDAPGARCRFASMPALEKADDEGRPVNANAMARAQNKMRKADVREKVFMMNESDE